MKTMKIEPIKGGIYISIIGAWPQVIVNKKKIFVARNDTIENVNFKYKYTYILLNVCDGIIYMYMSVCV